MNKRILVHLGLATLTACSDRQAPEPVREVITGNRTDERVPLRSGGPMTAGEWRQVGGGRSAELLFLAPEGVAFALSCSVGRGMVAELRGHKSAGRINMMRVSAGERSRRFAVNPISGETPTLRAILPADVDVTTMLRGAAVNITVDVEDGHALHLPASQQVRDLARRYSQL